MYVLHCQHLCDLKIDEQKRMDGRTDGWIKKALKFI